MIETKSLSIWIGTRNQGKIQAVTNVFMNFFPQYKVFVKGQTVDSGVPAQPIGLDNVLNGAIQRAKNIKIWYSNNISQREQKADYFVGIEAGLVAIPHTISGYLDYQFCAIINSNNQMTIGSGSGWEYPRSVVERIKSDPKIEIGDIMAEISGDPDVKYKNGAIGIFSHNLLTRPKITEECVQMALIPFLNEKLYFTTN
jgi:inosine/xanthosine triphosphatase